MNFLVDAQLPPALAARLCAAGHAAVHVTQVLPGNAPDIDLLRGLDSGALVVELR